MNAKMIQLEDAAWKQSISADSSASDTYHAILWQFACRYQMLVADRARSLGRMSTFIPKQGEEFMRKLVESDLGWYDTQLEGYRKDFEKTVNDLRNL